MVRMFSSISNPNSYIAIDSGKMSVQVCIAGFILFEEIVENMGSLTPQN